MLLNDIITQHHFPIWRLAGCRSGLYRRSRYSAHTNTLCWSSPGRSATRTTPDSSTQRSNEVRLWSPTYSQYSRNYGVARIPIWDQRIAYPLRSHTRREQTVNWPRAGVYAAIHPETGLRQQAMLRLTATSAAPPGRLWWRTPAYSLDVV